MALAVSAYKKKQVEKIILTAPRWRREKLGFLPGDLQNRSTLTCGRSTTRWGTCSASKIAKLIERQVIEVNPRYMK